MDFYVMTLFPEMIESGMHTSMTGKALEKGLINLHVVDIRDFSENKHKKVDDYPYGGGAGLVMQPGPVYGAYESICGRVRRRLRVIYLTPQGRVFDQSIAKEFAAEEELVFLCGHYEGIDERVLEEIVTDYISIGDYVLTGGELPAMVLMDCISRLVPGVLHNEDSTQTESFEENLLEYPQYTRPEVFHDRHVPQVLLSGHHANIEAWRKEQSIKRTKERRPDLYQKYLGKLISLFLPVTVLFFTVFTVLTGCAGSPQQKAGIQRQAYSITNFEAFDTVSKITAYADKTEDQTENLEELNSLLEEWDKLFDIYHSYQDEDMENLKTVNDQAGKQPVTVDSRILDVLEFAVGAEKITNGTCNIAFGSVLSLWHTCREHALHGEAVKLPSSKALSKAARCTDISNVIIDRDKGTVFLKDPRMSLDVGAVAKGYAADALAQRARELGMDSVLIVLGGNVKTVGRKLDQGDGSAWTVGIQDPDDPDNYLYKAFIEGKSLVTSGDYQRYFELDGKRYSHIIDPDTQYPAEKYRSVTIYTESSALADALSTALFIVDVDEGKKMLAHAGDICEALWIYADGSEEMTDGMQEILEK